MGTPHDRGDEPSAVRQGGRPGLLKTLEHRLPGQVGAAFQRHRAGQRVAVRVHVFGANDIEYRNSVCCTASQPSTCPDILSLYSARYKMVHKVRHPREAPALECLSRGAGIQKPVITRAKSGFRPARE